MKIADWVDIQSLKKFGFEEYNPSDYGDECLEYMEVEMIWNIGRSRRGQSYLFLILKDRTLALYATSPDGSGSFIELQEKVIDFIYELRKTSAITD